MLGFLAILKSRYIASRKFKIFPSGSLGIVNANWYLRIFKSAIKILSVLLCADKNFDFNKRFYFLIRLFIFFITPVFLSLKRPIIITVRGSMAFGRRVKCAGWARASP